MTNGVRVRIGGADRLLSRRPARIRHPLSHHAARSASSPSYDELYWNATGTGWTFAIEQAEARITLPEAVAVPADRVLHRRRRARRGQDATIVEQRPGRIVFRTTRPLPAAQRPDGRRRPGRRAWSRRRATAQVARWWLADNLRGAGRVASASLLVLGYYACAWLRVGRDPPRGTIIPLFAPPDGMSAAAVRYVDRSASTSAASPPRSSTSA